MEYKTLLPRLKELKISIIEGRMKPTNREVYTTRELTMMMMATESELETLSKLWNKDFKKLKDMQNRLQNGVHPNLEKTGWWRIQVFNIIHDIIKILP